MFAGGSSKGYQHRILKKAILAHGMVIKRNIFIFFSKKWLD
jgi:hypothetical protein